ncbi:hypothetical protein AB0F72_17065 [Actinoplanes sp. NPDC023936]|uniref:hypothetical protein n=1 Tax=Actinoplanes sp. NPDC023936 TaxID=3154910 RepID=UPI0033EEB48B
MPPRWKTFVLTAAVILILQNLVSALLTPLTTGWPPVLRSAVVITGVVALMTWVMMPRLTRWLAGWLRPAPQKPFHSMASRWAEEPSDGEPVSHTFRDGRHR